MPNKKIIILYSTAGMGHKKAAIAIHKAFEGVPDVDVENVDMLDYAKGMIKFCYLDAYVFLMTSARWLWGALYYFSDNKLVDILTRKMRSQFDFKSVPDLIKSIMSKKPDAIISTHFFLPSVAGILKHKLKLSSKLYTLVTDYGPHSYWLSKDNDKYFVGAEPVLEEFVKRGIEREKISVTGISTTDEFKQDFDVDELRERYELDKDKKTIFLMSGGFGVGPIGKMLHALNACKSKIQVITVCGHNKEAYTNISNMKEELDYPVIVFGFSDKVAELMAVSDIMVTKAGGISVTEALDSKLPMILFASIPGQETWNEKLLTEGGAAVKAKTVQDIPVIVDKMLSSDEVYASFKQGTESLRRPNAAEDIVKIVMGEI